MNIDLTPIVIPILLAVIAAVAPSIIATIAAFAVAAFRQVARALDLNQTDIDAIYRVARIAVNAAEQNGLFTTGVAKKDYAVQVVQTYFNARGVKIDLHAVDAAVEAAVLQEINAFKDPPPAPAATDAPAPDVQGEATT